MSGVKNLILATDSYKYSHFKQYPPGTTEVSAYIEARPGGAFNEVTFFGLQMLLKDYLSWRITPLDVLEAKEVVEAHGLPFNEEGWRRIVQVHKGYLPLEIEALPEGLTVPCGTPLVQLRNTDPALPWLTTFVETLILPAVWYPSTVATLSRHAKKIILAGLQKSSDDPAGQIGFKLHDFGGRGVTCREQAGYGGAAHLVNFMGTDTVDGLMYARRFYGADMPGFSIPAAEHSTITAWGRANEVAAYRNMLQAFGGTNKLVAVVSDSYDINNAVRHIWGDVLKSEVIGMGGTLVVRPDSGDPTLQPVRVLTDLDATFGSARNSRGFKVLNKAVRVIQGDGMTLETIRTLVRNVIDAGFSLDNIAFGMGGGLLQKVDRDTLRFAMKANEAIINGQARHVFKAPASDMSKASKAGRQQVVRQPNGSITTVLEHQHEVDETPLLQPVWRDGTLLKDWTFDEVRAAAALNTFSKKVEEAA